MILTGQAKEDFIQYLENGNHTPWLVFFESLPEIVRNAYIIEWFDDENININTTPFDYQVIHDNKEYNSYKNVVDHDRTEVQRLAIIIANKIYNSKFNKQQ